MKIRNPFSHLTRFEWTLWLLSMAAVALSFADCWNLVEQPLTYLTTRTELYPLSVVFNQLTQQSTGVEFAGAALYTLPALLIYLYFQNDILEGVQLTELK